MENYPCEAVSIAGFIQQIACWVRNGYFFYNLRHISPERTRQETRAKYHRVDSMLVSKYSAAISYAERSRRKKQGIARTNYIRYRNVQVLMATLGEHRFFDEEPWKDLRRRPLRFAGYAVGFRNGHVHVRISDEAFRRLKTRLLRLAERTTVPELMLTFKRLPYEPWAPIRSQYLQLHRTVNGLRAPRGLPPVPRSCVRLYRKPLSPFGERRKCACRRPQGGKGAVMIDGGDAEEGYIRGGRQG